MTHGAKAVAVLVVSSGCAIAAGCRANPQQQSYLADFDDAWLAVAENYCFFPDGPDDWRHARNALRPRAADAATTADLIRVLEQLLNQLADPHTHLRTNLPSSHRLVPHDVWAVRAQDGLRIEAVRSGGAAEAAGVRPGDLVLRINDVPAPEAADAIRPRFSPMPHAALDQWSVLVALAGTHDTPRTWTVRSPGSTRTIELDAPRAAQRPHEPLVAARSLSPGVGLIRISGFAAPDAIEQFDAALDRMKDKPAIILDVRNNRGGDTAVARPIMGRFVTERTAYATMRRRDGAGLSEPWTEYVEPRGEPYSGRTVVLVDRFSVSMAEGFAMGMRTIAGATIVGTRMAGLGAAIDTFTLPESAVTMQISTEPVYTIHGEPRWTLTPDVEVSADALRSSEDAILDAALRFLSR